MARIGTEHPADEVGDPCGAGRDRAQRRDEDVDVLHGHGLLLVTVCRRKTGDIAKLGFSLGKGNFRSESGHQPGECRARNYRFGGRFAMNFRTLDLNLLRVFAAVMLERNVTRAGAQLAMTQPAVSNALRRLREATGDELFVTVRAASCRRRTPPPCGRTSKRRSRDSATRSIRRASIRGATCAPSRWRWPTRRRRC
jgi:hypothetical protein